MRRSKLPVLRVERIATGWAVYRGHVLLGSCGLGVAKTEAQAAAMFGGRVR